uniref:ABC transporter permease n=1 Tax=Streptomyces sp. PU-14G TaxID=2800808 RepID=UPI0034DF0CE6
SPHVAPKATLAAQARLAQHARLTRGRMPSPTAGHRDAEQQAQGRRQGRRVQAAVTEATARRMRLAPGDSFHLPDRTGAGESGVTVQITGVLAPRGSRQHVEHSPFWNAEQSLARPSLLSIPPAGGGGAQKRYWHFTAFIHPKAAPALLSLRDGAELYFHYPLDTDALAGHQARRAAQDLTRLASGTDAARLRDTAGVGELTFDSGLTETLAAFERENSAVAPLLLTAALGLATTALTVLLLAATLTAERRASELALLRARGASLPGLAGRLLAESAPVAVPAGALGTGLALAATDGTRTAAALAAAAAVTALAALALPLRAALAHRRVRTAAPRGDLTRRRPSRRRTVVEVGTFVLAVAAVVALRQRGTGGQNGTQDPAATGGTGQVGTAGDTDLLPALAPVLVALAAALLLLRCYPLPLRLLERLTARRPGPVAFLGVARAGRAPSAAVSGPALLALLVALTVASFGGTVLAGIAHGRDTAALRAVGADARIETPGGENLPAGLAKKVRHTPGVDTVTAYRAHDDGELTGVADAVTVALVDAPSYARLTGRNGQGTLPADALLPAPSEASTEPLPALMSPGLAGKLGNGAEYTDLVLPGLQLPVRPALIRDTTPATQQGDFVVLSREAVARARPDVRGTALLAPNTLLAGGPAPDAGALRRLAAAAFPKTHTDPLVTLRAEERAEYAGTVLHSGAEHLYALAVLAAAGYSALAVGLSLSQTAPDRRALLSRLRTLGLARRQGRGVLLLESLPLYVLTAAAGAATGLATVPLLGPGIDLGALAGTPDTLPVRLTPDPVPVLAPPLALLALATLGLLAQARHRGRAADLRTENQEPS